MMKNNLYWNKNFAGEKIVIEYNGLGSIVRKSVLIANMKDRTVTGDRLRPIDYNQDTVWILDSDDEHGRRHGATHVDASNIIWFENTLLNTLYVKEE